jgi:hypothetical protein
MAKRTAARRPAIQIVAYYEDVDLRFISAVSTSLNKIADEHKLQNGDAIIYTNVKQSRFRLVLRAGEMCMVCAPERDAGDSDLSIYLRISEALAKLARVQPTIQVDLEALKRATEERIAFREALAEKRRAQEQRLTKKRKNGKKR